MAYFVAPYFTAFNFGTDDNDKFFLWNWNLSYRGYIYGQGGNDSFFISENFKGLVWGGAGVDLASFGDTSFGVTLNNTRGYVVSSTGVTASADRYHGTSFDDVFIGGDVDRYLDNPWDYNNDFYGGAGNDTFYNGNGRGRFEGERGNDTAYGGDDRLVFFGGVGNDRGYGGNGNDGFYGGDDRDYLLGNGGNDWIRGGDGGDLLFGGDDNDQLRGDEGNDQVYSGAGTDRAYGGSGNDFVSGGSENDQVWGDSGNDRVDGGDGNDMVDGGFGNDVVVGGYGVDVLYGDRYQTVDGADTFTFRSSYPGGPRDTGTVQDGTHDQIMDFDVLDRIEIPFGHSFAGLTAAVNEGEYGVTAFGSGWLVRWNTNGEFNDVVVFGENPVDQVFATYVPLI
ncbi:MAG: calcium-binding protein [Pseudomonadota bacterium]